MADKDKQKSKGKGGRSTVLAGLLAVVALVAIWLSDCIPGFGIGAGTKEGEAEQSEKAEKAESVETPSEQPSVRKPMPMKLTIDARGCMINGGDPIDCSTLCEDASRFEGVDSVTIDAKDGPHEPVVAALDCLKSKKLSVAITRE